MVADPHQEIDFEDHKRDHLRARFCRSLYARVRRRFERVLIPSSFSALQTRDVPHIVVAPGKSLVVSALLDSFTDRLGAPRYRHLRSRGESVNSNHRVWVSLDELQDLQTYLRDNPSTRLSTLNIFRWRGPVRYWKRPRFGWFRKLGLILAPHLYLIVFGRPFPISEEQRQRGLSLRRALRVDFYKNLKLVRGTPFQSRGQQAEMVLTGAEANSELAVIARREGITVARARKLARRAFYQMAANPWRPFFSIIVPVTHFLLDRLFSQVITEGLERFVAAHRRSTVIIVPMHRSHLDYVILTYKLYEANLNPPLVAAGINLSFWPFGFIFRSLGAYFVKRDARSDRFHTFALRRYVSYLIKRGHLQEFFIEGGRSRSGRMRPPKLGLLAVMVNAYLRGARKDLIFVPVSITYENVIEDVVYGDENTGSGKKSENLLSLLRARDLLRHKRGEVMVHFGQPISLSDFLEKVELENRRPDRAGKGPSERRLVHSLAQTITNRLRLQTNLSLTSLIYTALMLAPRYGLTKSELEDTVLNLGNLAEKMRSVYPQMGSFTPPLTRFLEGGSTLLEAVARSRNISVHSCLGEEVYYIRGKRRFTADFYRNNAVHLFLPVWILSINELIGRTLNAANAKRWHELLAFDYQLPTWSVFRAEIEATIAALLEAAILVKVASGEPRFAKRILGVFVPTLLMGTIDSHLWVRRQLSLAAATSRADGDEYGPPPLLVDDLLARWHSEARTANYLDLMTRTEASSRSTLVAALQSLQQRGEVQIDGYNGQRRVTINELDQNAIQLLTKSSDTIRNWLNQQRRDQLDFKVGNL